MTILRVFSQFLWNLKFIFSGSRKKLSLVLLQISYYIYSPLKNVKKNIVWLKIFWCKGFVHWKLKLLNFLLYSVLILYGENNFCHQVMVEWFVIQILLNFKIFKLSKNLSPTHYRAQIFIYKQRKSCWVGIIIIYEQILFNNSPFVV